MRVPCLNFYFGVILSGLSITVSLSIGFYFESSHLEELNYFKLSYIHRYSIISASPKNFDIKIQGWLLYIPLYEFLHVLVVVVRFKVDTVPILL